MKIKTFVVAALLLAFGSTISAQNDKTGFGVRAGLFNGLTAKHFISTNNAIEGIVNFRWDGVIVTGLYEWQRAIFSAPGFDYILSAGAHVGFFNNYK